VSERTYNDGQWHSVTFSRHHTSGNLSIDDEIVRQGSSGGFAKVLTILSPYYVGGISPNISGDVKANIKV
jgi:hypothetical protein